MALDARSGIGWTALEKILVVAVGFAQGVLLARLLSPADFGLVAMLAIFLSVGGTLAESGLGTALVVRGGDERRALVWNLGIAMSIYAFLFLSASLVADFYGASELRPLLRVMALGIVINAGGVVAFARLTRQKRFGCLSGINSVCAVVGAAVAVGLAFAGFGVWAIAATGIVLALIRTLASWWLARGFVVAADSSAREFPLGFGLKLMISGLVMNVYSNLHQLVIGRVYSSAMVGLFNRANRWAQLPGEIVNESVGRVALPMLSEKGGARHVKQFLFVNCAVMWVGLAILRIWDAELVGFVLGSRWLDSIPYLRVLLVGAAMTPVSNVMHKVMLSSGDGGLVLKADFIKKPAGIAFVLMACLAMCKSGSDGVLLLCWACVASQAVDLAVNVAFARSVLNRRRRIHFVYRRDRDNAGDWASCPGRYYDFGNVVEHDIYSVRWKKIRRTDVVILGGGGLVDCIKEWNETVNRLFDVCDTVIGWGIGENREANGGGWSCPVKWERFTLLGRRDGEGERWLPCVSCKMPELSETNGEPTSGVGVIGHKDHPLDGAEITNAHPARRIINYIGRHGRIRTNTYHGWYWAMLMGKQVDVVADWSSKFRHLPQSDLAMAREMNDRFYERVLEVMK